MIEILSIAAIVLLVVVIALLIALLFGKTSLDLSPLQQALQATDTANLEKVRQTVEQRLGILQEESGKKLTEMRQESTTAIQKSREEVTTALKTFNESVDHQRFCDVAAQATFRRLGAVENFDRFQ